MLRFYVVPVIGSGSSHLDARRPKYFSDFAGGSLPYGSMDFGLEPVMLVAADISTDQHATISVNPDVIVIPADIDQRISSVALEIVQLALENMNIPAGWVTTSHTYRSVLRVVVGIFQFMQRYQANGGSRLFGGAVILGTQFNQLSAVVRNRMIQTANDLNYDTSSLSASSTLRAILKALGDQWGNKTIIIGGFSL